MFKPLYVLVSYFIKGIMFLCWGLLCLSKKSRVLVARLDRGYRIEILNDDIIVMLDASWRKDAHELVSVSKSRGNVVIGVIYDLIPVTHPHLFNESLVNEFNQWLEWITKTANGFMTISKTVRDQTKSLMKERLLPNDFEQRWFDYFYLGSELDLIHNTEVSQNVTSVFNKALPVYLMVSTIEPRKNHAYLLDAFGELWAQNQKVILCFVGQIGWKCESLLERIHGHPENNKRLFMLNDLNDTDLEFAYQHSKALVFSSFEEGFGLPIVEAMQRGLPVMASNIPVFREIGEDYCAFFELDDPGSLCELVESFELTGKFPSAKQLEGYQWLTWKQATHLFLQKIKSHVAR